MERPDGTARRARSDGLSTAIAAGSDARHVRTLPRLPEWQTICGVLDRMMAPVVTGGVAVPTALRLADEEVVTILSDARL